MYMHISIWAIAKIKNKEIPYHPQIACGIPFPDSSEEPSTVIQDRDIDESTKEIKKTVQWNRLADKVTCPKYIIVLKENGL